jgi:heme exporter protein D
MTLTRFQFDSLQDMLSMSGHGPYVWACYGITLAAVLWLLINPLVQQRRFIREQQRLQQLREKPQV